MQIAISGRRMAVSSYLRSLVNAKMARVFRHLSDAGLSANVVVSRRKLDKLVDFLLLRNQADRLNIQLTDAAVFELVHRRIFASRRAPVLPFDADASKLIERDVRSAYVGATPAVILEALRDEFRVQLAQRPDHVGHAG